MDSYPITTKQLLVIAAQEVGKTIPIFGAAFSTQESIFDTIEINRIRKVLAEVFLRLEQLEKDQGKTQVLDQKGYGVLMHGADQVRSDILAEAKVKEYGSVIASYVVAPDDLNAVFEVLDCLRKLSASDLKILYQFRLGGKLVDNRLVAELAEYPRLTNPFEAQAIVRKNMEILYPSLMRLEGLGVIYLSHSHTSGGEVYLDIGGLSEHLRKFAILTESGRRLVAVLPR